MPGRQRPFEAVQSVLHHGDLSACQQQQPPELNELVFLSLVLEGCSVGRNLRVLFRLSERLPVRSCSISACAAAGVEVASGGWFFCCRFIMVSVNCCSIFDISATMPCISSALFGNSR
jgi:hypothetical protein